MFDHGKVIQVGDAKLFVSEAGYADGQPIVLLHGGLGSRNDFLPLAEHLASQYRLIAIDSRGHGCSEIGHLPMTYHQLEKDVIAVLTELELNEAGIIGHSDGGIVALRLAASGRVQPRFVVAVGAHWGLPADDPVRTIYTGITVDEWRSKFAQKIERYEAENPLPDFAKLFEATRMMWLGCDNDAYPGKRVSAITSPLLVVHGDDDVLVSRRQAFELTEQVKHARLLNLPFATHTVLEDNPMLVVAALHAFLAGLKY